jgi:MFS family permease
VITQPIYTNISDVLGRMIPLYTAFVLFIAGSIIFALANNMKILIVGRVIQGLGGGGLDVLNEIILADITTLKERPMYLGLMAIPVAAGSIIGPIVGGVLAQYATWRWIGWINLPLCAINIALVVFFMKLKPIHESLGSKLRRLDVVGLCLYTVGCTLTATPIAWAGAMYPWSAYQTILPLVLGIIILVLFGWYESRPAEPVFPHRIFKNRTAVSSLLAAFLHGLVVYSIIFFTPLYFQAVYLEQPMKSAISTLPLACSSVAFGIIGAVAVEVTRKYSLLILSSWVLVAVGCGILSLWGDDASLAMRVTFQIILGIGTGNIFSILNLPLQASVPHVDDMGIAAGILVSFRLFGALLGLSMCSTVFNSLFAKHMSSIGPLPDAVATLNDVKEAVGFIPLLREVDISAGLLDKLTGAYMQSMYGVFWMLAGVSVIGFVVSLLIKEISLEKEGLGRQQYEADSNTTEDANSTPP